MSQSSSAHHNQSPSSSNNNNDDHDDFQQQQPPIIVVESDDDDHDDVMLLETVQRTLPSPPVVCLVKTGGQLDYHDDCLCVKCRMIKEFLAKFECKQPNCSCGECRQAAEVRQNGDAADPQQQPPQVYNGDNRISDDDANEVEHPEAPLEPTDNAPQPEAALSPDNYDDDDDDERYSRSSTPEFDPFNDDDDDEEDEDEDGNEELDQGDGSNDSSGANPKMPTSSSSSVYDKKDTKANPNECPFCKSKAHNSTSSMSTHYRVAHLNWKPYYCKWTNCAFESGYSKAVETHVRWKHLKTDKATKHKKQKAVDYVGKHTEDQPPTDKLLSDHLLKNTGIKWPVTSALEPTIPNCACPECGRRFARPDLLECHVESHDSAGFRCTWPNCGYFYSGAVTAAKLHICHNHLGSSTGYSLRDMKEAKRYLQLVGGNTASSSAISDSKGSQPSTSFALTNQYNEDNDALDDDDVNVCDNASSSRTSSPHQSQNQQPEPINDEFICPHTNCLKRFPTKTRYELHMITHSNKKPFECSHCMYKSKMKSNVATHFRREHSREKLFRCAFTGCSFEHSVYLDVTRHIRVVHSALECESGNWKKVFKKYVERCYLVSKKK